MAGLLEVLSRAVEGSLPVALAAALVWGVASVVLSPCHLASIPLVVGFVNRDTGATPARGAVIAAVFALGLLTTIAAVGGATAAAGRLLGAVGPWTNYLVVIVLFVFGLALLDVIPIGWNAPDTARFRGRGPGAAFLLGLVFGVGLGPCTFAFMAPMLGVTFAVGGTRVWHGVLLMAAFAVGHCAVIVLAGTSTAWVARYLHWTESSRGARALRYASGALVLLGGLYLLYTTADQTP